MDIIEINYPNGEMELDRLYVIHDMLINDFKIFVKLFAMYNEPLEHREFIGICKDIIEDYQKDISVFEEEKNTYQLKADGREYTVFSREYCKKLANDVQKRINGLNTKINRLQRKIDILKGYMG